MEKRIIGLALIFVIIIGGGGYIYAQNEVSNAVIEILDSIELVDVRLEDFSLFPPSATIIGIYVVSNPSNYDIEMQMDLDLYTGDYYIGDIEFDEKIRSRGKTTFEVEIPLSSSLLQSMEDSGEELETLTVTGDLFGKGKVFVFPVSITRRLDNEELPFTESEVPDFSTESSSEPTGDTSKIVVLETNKGVIEIELDEEAAPTTVRNFIRYVEDGSFDGTVFHRVMSDFMIQGGGFTPDGTQKYTRDPIQLESNNGLENLRGTIAMARTSEPNSATNQFFINLVDNSFLNYGSGQPGYAVFGRVISGMDVVDDIGSVSTGMRGPYSNWPVEDVLIERAYMKS